MDKATQLALNAIAKSQDDLLVKFAALVAIVGAMSEKTAIDPARVDAWCRAIAEHSDPKIGVAQTAVQRVAHDLLQGITEAPKN